MQFMSTESRQCKRCEKCKRGVQFHYCIHLSPFTYKCSTISNLSVNHSLGRKLGHMKPLALEWRRLHTQMRARTHTGYILTHANRHISHLCCLNVTVYLVSELLYHLLTSQLAQEESGDRYVSHKDHSRL